VAGVMGRILSSIFVRVVFLCFVMVLVVNRAFAKQREGHLIRHHRNSRSHETPRLLIASLCLTILILVTIASFFSATPAERLAFAMRGSL
jgi:hypothetical protein